jgi:hypothetical protein
VNVSQINSLGKSDFFRGSACAVFERGYPAAEDFIAQSDDDDLKRLISRLFRHCEIAIIIRQPSGVLNSVGVAVKEETAPALRATCDLFFPSSRSRWGLFCSPAVVYTARLTLMPSQGKA